LHPPTPNKKFIANLTYCSPEGALTIYSSKLSPKNFSSRPGEHRHPLHPLAVPMQPNTPSVRDIKLPCNQHHDSKSISLRKGVSSHAATNGQHKVYNAITVSSCEKL